MVLDAFGVELGGSLVDTEGAQEIEDEHMAPLGLGGKRLSPRGQSERLARLRKHESLGGESTDDSADRDMGEAKTLGNSADAGLDASVKKVADRLAVVLRGLSLVLGAQHAGTQVASMLGVVGEPLEEGALGPLPRLALGRRGWVF